MEVTRDCDASFVDALSLLAALEGVCVPAGAGEWLPYLGMARAELTEYGQRLPARLGPRELTCFEAGLTELDLLLSRMLTESEDLGATLRLQAAQALLRETPRP